MTQIKPDGTSTGWDSNTARLEVKHAFNGLNHRATCGSIRAWQSIQFKKIVPLIIH